MTLVTQRDSGLGEAIKNVGSTLGKALQERAQSQQNTLMEALKQNEKDQAARQKAKESIGLNEVSRALGKNFEDLDASKKLEIINAVGSLIDQGIPKNVAFAQTIDAFEQKKDLSQFFPKEDRKQALEMGFGPQEEEEQQQQQQQQQQSLLEKLIGRIQSKSPEIAEQRQRTFDQSGTLSKLLKNFEERREDTLKQRQEIFEQPTDFLGEIKRTGPALLRGGTEGATSGLAKFKEEDPEDEVAQAFRKGGRVLGTFIPYGVGLKALGYGTRFLTKMAAVTGLRGKALTSSLNLFGSAFLGRSLAEASSIGFRGKPLTTQEARRAGLEFMALAAAPGAFGFLKNLNGFMGHIAKKANISKTQAYKEIIRTAKNAGVQFFKGKVPTATSKTGVIIEDIALTEPEAQTVAQTVSNLEQEAVASPQTLASRVSKDFPESQTRRGEQVQEKRVSARPTTITEREASIGKAKQELADAQNKQKTELDKLANLEDQLPKLSGSDKKQVETLIKSQKKEVNRAASETLNKFEAIRSKQKELTPQKQEIGITPKTIPGRFSKDFPESQARRAEEVRKKRPLLRKEAEIKGREKELAAAEKLPTEVESAQAKKDIEKEKRAATRPTTIAKREAISEKSRQELPVAQKKQRAALEKLTRLQDQLPKLFGAGKQRVEALVKFQKREADRATDELLNKFEEIRFGKEGLTSQEQKAIAHTKVQDIFSKILEGEDVKLSLRDYNPERVKNAKQIRKLEKKLKLPQREKKFDPLFRAHENYAEIFRKELANIDQKLESLKDSGAFGALKERGNLKRLQDVLKKLVEHAEADVTIHNHNMNLRQFGRTRRLQQRIKGDATTQITEPSKAFSKEGLERMLSATTRLVANPSSATAQGAVEAEINASRTKGPKAEKAEKASPEEIKAKTEEVKGATEEVKEKAKGLWEKLLGGKPASLKAAERLIREFVNSLKESGHKAFFQTPLGRAILFETIVQIGEKASGEKLPFQAKSLLSLLGGAKGRGARVVISGIISAYRFIIEKIDKSALKKAIKAQDFKKINEIKKNLKPKDIKDVQKQIAQERLSS